MAKARCALLLLLTLRGTPFLYQGDEIGLTDGPIEKEDLHDAVGIRFWPYYKGRDAERTPMPWSDAPNGGFTSRDATPWLPMADPAECNVAQQAADPDSTLAFTRRVIARRSGNEDLAVGAYRSLTSPDGGWVFARGDQTVVALNMSDDQLDFNVSSGTITVATDRCPRRHAPPETTLSLSPWSGVVIES